MTSKSIKHMIILALLTTIALTVFIIEAQIPVPVPIPGVKLGLANVITLIVLIQYRIRDAAVVLLVRILLGAMFSGTVTNLLYSLCGGLLCLAGMALMSRILKQKYIWFISVIGAVLHNTGQILAAMLVMQTVHVAAYFPFLLLTGCATGLFTGFAASCVIRHWSASVSSG